MDSFSSPSSGSSPNFSKEYLMDQLKVQLAQAYAEEFLEWAENALTSASPNLAVALVAVRAVASPGVWIVILRPLVSLVKHSSTNSTESYVELLETQFE